MQEICPNCRSTFELNGTFDLSAPSLQDVNCPVCDQDIWVASGLWPQRWSVGAIITAQPYVKPQPVQQISAQDSKPVWSGFTIPGLNQVGQWLQDAGIFIIVVLVLVLLIKWKK